jgi:hypothetical protein
VHNGKVRVVVGPKTKAYLDQLHEFPAGTHDDMVDASSGAYNFLQRSNYATVGAFPSATKTHADSLRTAERRVPGKPGQSPSGTGRRDVF